MPTGLSVFDGLICPIMDARRGQVYTGIYKADGDGLTCLSEQKAVDIHDILKELEEYDEKVIFLGDGVEVHRETIENELKMSLFLHRYIFQNRVRQQ